LQTQDYIAYQLQLENEDLKRYYQGHFILEVWSRAGERIFQKVLREECKRWSLCNNVFAFKQSSEASTIQIIWLNERKMASIKHPYENCQGKLLS